MSAFIVGDDHLNALLTYAVDRRISYWNPRSKERTDITSRNVEEVGRILLDENVRSVDHRYGGRIDADEKDAGARYTFQRWTARLSPVQVLKAVACLDYQSCETNDWDNTLAYRICQAIKDRAISDLPGYEAAQWEIRKESVS